MGTGEDVALGGGHAVQCSDLVTQKATPGTSVIIFISVTPAHLI